MLDVEFDEAVGEQDAGAGLEIFGERLEGGADERGGAFDLAGRDGEALAGDQLDGLVVLELAGADLGALQVGEDADGLAFFARDRADHLDELGLLGVGAVGEVEAGTSRPARTSWRKTSGVLQAGPRVATILARRVRSDAWKWRLIVRMIW